MYSVSCCYMLCCQSKTNDDVFIPFKIYHSLESAKKAAVKYLKRYPTNVYKVIFWEGGIL